MTTSSTTHHHLDDLRQEWRSLGRSRASRLAFLLLREVHPRLEETRATDLADIVELLEPGSGLTQIERAELASSLLEVAPQDPLLIRALLQTLLPGLVAVARRLDWGRGRSEDPGAFLGDLISLTYEVILEWGGQRRPYAAPDLLNAVRCRMRRQLLPVHRQREVAHGLLTDTSWVIATFDEDPLESIAGMLKEAGGDLDPVGVTALYGREVLGLTYRELAERTGISTRRLSAAGQQVARRILQ